MPPDDRIESMPDFVAIGHAARDLLPGGGWRLGGSVAFAALTASRLGLRSAVVTSGPPDVIQALHQTLPGIEIAAVPSIEATVFENIYTGGLRQQYLRGRAQPLRLEDVPLAWRAAPLILFAPLAAEIGPDLPVTLDCTAERLVAATLQGWLRHVDDKGAVSAAPFDLAEQILPHLGAIILSYEDLLQSPDRREELDRATALLSSWALTVPQVAVTRGAAGAALFQAGQLARQFPGYPAVEVDPTGAGDVFAAAFLVSLYRTGDAAVAMDFANQVAACSVEQLGVAGIPTCVEVLARFGSSIS